MIIATHSGKFHADDVWAVAVLDLVFPGRELVRTRDAQVIEAADFAVDVGGVWNPDSGRFDHHPKGFQGARPSGVVYASAGLVWKTYGPRCVSLLAEQRTGCSLTPAGRLSMLSLEVDRHRFDALEACLQGLAVLAVIDDRGAFRDVPVRPLDLPAAASRQGEPPEEAHRDACRSQGTCAPVTVTCTA